MNDRDWEAHYQAGDTPWNHGEAAPGLIDFLTANPGLARRPVLVPGCGLGQDALAWAKHGFPTVGLDLAPTATALARGIATSVGPGGVTFRSGDFLSAPDAGETFGWVFEHTLYCAISPERRADYARAVERWLEPGGSFVAIHYLNPAAPEGPPFGCTREEILRRFAGGFELVSDWSPRSWSSREGREWMFWWRRR